MKQIIGIAALAALLAATACGEQTNAPDAVAAAQAPDPVGVIASDAVSNLSAAPTGIDFWTHPNVSFNSLLIVASESGLASYNIEDGGEVSRAPGVSLRGVAVSYIGYGPLAAGIAAAYDETRSAFQFYGVDNVTRLFVPLSGGPTLRGAVRGFCMGRAAKSPDPTLFVIQRGEMTIYNVTPAIDGDRPGIVISGETGLPIPETAMACAVDNAGAAYILGDDGKIFRVDSENSFDAPFAMAFANDDAEIAFLGAAPSEDNPSAQGQIAALNRDTGIIEFFDAEDGRALGAIKIDAGDEIEAVTQSVAIGASGANLGGLYRDGAIALGVAGDTPAVRLIPANGAANALDMPALAPANPRGHAPRREEEDSGLIINPTLPASR